MGQREWYHCERRAECGSLYRGHCLGGHWYWPVDLAMYRQQRRNNIKLYGFASRPGRGFCFLQTLGINTHLSYPGTPYYGQPQSVITALQYLGINTIRDQPPAYTSDPTTAAANDAVAAAGVQFDALLLSNGPVNITDTLATTANFQQTYPGSIAAIEGPNEVNGTPVTYEGIPGTYAASIQVTQDLWAAVQANSSLNAVPVYAVTLSNGITGVRAAEKQLGNLAPYVTYGNAHIYACCSNNVWQEDMPYWLPIFERKYTEQCPLL